MVVANIGILQGLNFLSPSPMQPDSTQYRLIQLKLGNFIWLFSLDEGLGLNSQIKKRK